MVNQIGLILVTENNQNNPNSFINQIVVTVLLAMELKRIKIFRFSQDLNGKSIIMFGDFPTMSNIGLIYNNIITGALITPLAIKMVYYWNYKNNRKPTFLKAFQMTSKL